MKLSNVIPLVVFFAFGTILAFSTNLASKAAFTPSMIGKTIENFQTEDLITGSGFSNKDFADNDITILNLFASWCVSCNAEHEFIKGLTAKGFVVYGLDVADTRENALKYLDSHGNPYKKIGFDPRQQLAIALGATGVPETFILDKNGLIYFHQRGMIDKDIVERQMMPIIEGMQKKLKK